MLKKIQIAFLEYQCSLKISLQYEKKKFMWLQLLNTKFAMNETSTFIKELHFRLWMIRSRKRKTQNLNQFFHNGLIYSSLFQNHHWIYYKNKFQTLIIPSFLFCEKILTFYESIFHNIALHVIIISVQWYSPKTVSNFQFHLACVCINRLADVSNTKFCENLIYK